MNAPFPTFGNPEDHPDNLRNPYGYQVQDESQGLAYFNAPESNSTMVSDSVVMTKRLKAFVPVSSVKEGRSPKKTLMTADELAQENAKGGDYEASYQ